MSDERSKNSLDHFNFFSEKNLELLTFSDYIISIYIFRGYCYERSLSLDLSISYIDFGDLKLLHHKTVVESNDYETSNLKTHKNFFNKISKDFKNPKKFPYPSDKS